jgi:hypothetical protein
MNFMDPLGKALENEPQESRDLVKKFVLLVAEIARTPGTLIDKERVNQAPLQFL